MSHENRPKRSNGQWMSDAEIRDRTRTRYMIGTLLVALVAAFVLF